MRNAQDCRERASLCLEIAGCLSDAQAAEFLKRQAADYLEEAETADEQDHQLADPQSRRKS